MKRLKMEEKASELVIKIEAHVPHEKSMSILELADWINTAEGLLDECLEILLDISLERLPLPDAEDKEKRKC